MRSPLEPSHAACAPAAQTTSELKSRRSPRLTLGSCLALLLVAAAATTGSAARLEAGDPPFTVRYVGWIQEDRWGDLWLVSGVHAARLITGAQDKVRPFLHQEVTMRAAPMAPPVFERQISAVYSVEPAEPGSTKRPVLELRLSHAEAGRAFAVITWTCSTDQELRFKPSDLALVLRRRGTPRQPEEVASVTEEGQLPWKSDGKAWERVSETVEEASWQFRPAGSGFYRIRGEITFHAEITVGAAPGQYEAWCAFGDASLSRATGSTSRRIPITIPK